MNIANGSEELEVLCLLETSAPDLGGDTRHLSLTRGGKEKQTDNIVEVYGEMPGPRITVTADPNVAVGQYLHLLEIHGVDEERAYNIVADCAGDLYDEYRAWRDGFSLRDRQLRLLDQAEADSEDQSFYDPVLDGSGSWRTVRGEADRPSGVERRASAIASAIDTNPKHCYRNAQEAALEFDDVTYVEGIGLTKHAARIVGHAWIEVDDTVVELTWPWHSPVPPTEAVYFGTAVSTEEIRSAGTLGGPILLDVDDPSMLG